MEQFRPRTGVVRVGKLDEFKGQIVRWLDAHPYSAQQIYQRLHEAGYQGGRTIVKDYVQRIRPRAQAAFLKLDFAPGEAAKVDWGEYGTIAVGYVKKNLLAGLELADFAAMQPAAMLWVNTVADVRTHEATQQRPIDRFEDERAHLGRLNPASFDLARVCTVRATKQFRVPLDSNHYSVPSKNAGQRLTLKAYADRVCLYERDQLIARHPRSMDRHQDIEDPEHAHQLVVQRKSAREQRLLVQFLALSPRAQAYREGLEAKRVNARVHLRKILALAEIYGKEAVVRAIDDGLELQAFSAEYIANILDARRRMAPEPAALQLTRRADLLELELPEPDLSIYERTQGAD